VCLRARSADGFDGPAAESSTPVAQAATPRKNRERGAEAAGDGARHERPKVWSKEMAQVCDICGKGPRFGNNVSHAHNVTRRRWNPNLQAVRALVNGAAKKIRVCTSCIKSGKIQKA
jgi:large subunit ribosomal protein L28